MEHLTIVHTWPLQNHLREKHSSLFCSAVIDEENRVLHDWRQETNPAKGIFNLRVKDVRLGEDENFECQVSPGKGSHNSIPLRAPVKITIQGKRRFPESKLPKLYH